MIYLFYGYALPLLICLAFFLWTVWEDGYCGGDLADFLSYGLMPVVNIIMALTLVLGVVTGVAELARRRLLRSKP